MQTMWLSIIYCFIKTTIYRLISAVTPLILLYKISFHLIKRYIYGFLSYISLLTLWKPCLSDGFTHFWTKYSNILFCRLADVQNTVTATLTQCINVKQMCANNFFTCDLHHLAFVQFALAFFELNPYYLYFSFRRYFGDVNVFSQF